MAEIDESGSKVQIQDTILPEDGKPTVSDLTATTSSTAGDHALMSVSVRFAEQAMTLKLTDNGLAMEPGTADAKQRRNSKLRSFNCKWCEVIAVKKPENTEDKCQDLTVHFMEQQKNKTWRLKSVSLSCQEDEFDSIFNTIQQQCQKVPNRPKKLFVLINPIGGNRRGPHLYQTKIAPIFALAGCETTVVTSERPKHALEIGETQDFTGYDGIICVSGDGLYQELLEGYTKQLQRAAGVDIDDPQAKLVKPTIPFCLMPTGSSNGIVRYTNDGVRDVETSALRVLRGEVHPLNILTVHEPGKLVGVCGLAFAVGLMADIIKHSDDRRWMRKARYAYSMAAFLLKKRRQYEANVEYILEPGEGAALGNDEDTHQEWTTFEGQQHTSTVYLLSRLVYTGSKAVLDPYSSSGYLVIDTGCSNWGLIKFARALMTQQANSQDIPNLAPKDKAVAMRITLLKQDSVAWDEEVKGGDKESKAGTKETDVDGGDKESKAGTKEIDMDGNDKAKATEPSAEGVGDGKPKQSEQTTEVKNSEESGEVKVGSDAQQTKEAGKAEDVRGGATQKRNNRTREADEELEHYIYLDGEVRRTEGFQFECRLHSGFVPMFGCLPSGLDAGTKPEA